MMQILDLPATLAVFLALSLSAAGQAGQVTNTITPVQPSTTITTLVTLPSSGSGSSYAQACQNEYVQYSAASSSWDQMYGWRYPATQIFGGTSISYVTYYENATTLCDGHPRVSYSPAISLSTGNITYRSNATSTSVSQVTEFWNFPAPMPSCSISPSDCDPLWSSYSASLTAWQQANRTVPYNASITPPPQTPICANSSAASAYASDSSLIYGCGPCTIYGMDVQLVYFPVPTTVSRNLCADESSANVTHYINGDNVIEVYAGTAYRGNNSVPGQVTATAGGHTFTSGTAYISISSVYALDRCGNTKGTPVTNAILAMSSESVLSLRYSQDHFQLLMTTEIQTGYPVSYADFNEPVPWSAWKAQASCEYGGVGCSIIYAGQYKPQLAIPPGIKKLNPEWEGCQMWYNGLWDPPLALQPVNSIPPITYPHTPGWSSSSEPTSSASPGWSPGSPTTPYIPVTITPTAIPETVSSWTTIEETSCPSDPSNTDPSPSCTTQDPHTSKDPDTITIIEPTCDCTSASENSIQSASPTNSPATSSAPTSSSEPASNTAVSTDSAPRFGEVNSFFVILVSGLVALGNFGGF
ncbi:Hypothetical protein R9X50_00673500 [Acrodontium crateriforme]|uniref:Uncharacterized protein n=1 Tax=Acrodontium crateriforme TaxID=150365 RepID=A0AAQ3M8D9_9PEZI|nr:Hypothetical protein R9X50_00673500 [Acrodontium crateriforme]